ncbi:MAG: Stp1/IreP family PP2C-type Ser/Thr phosphatase [Polyangiaceae bacterium]
MSASALRAIAAGLSDVGLQREHNEDSFVVLKEYDLFVVADGMGGHRAGDVASKLATETISEFFKSTANEDVTWPFHFDTNLSEEENRLLTGIRVANRQIFERSTRSREYHGMGTTVVGAMFSPSKKRMYIGHVGDSRCYRVREGKIEQLTRDHSLINDYLLAMPDLTDEQRSELPKNVITRALGMQDQVVVDLQHDDPHPGDIYILCSDGLSGMIEDAEIQNIIQRAPNIGDACRELIAKANEHGGEDNITAVVIKIEDLADGASIDLGTSSTGQLDAVPNSDDAPTAPADPAELRKEAEASAPSKKKTTSGENKRAAAAAIAAGEKAAADKTVIHSGDRDDESATFAEEPTMPGIGLSPLPIPDLSKKKGEK